MDLDQWGVLEQVAYAVLVEEGDLDSWDRCRILDGDAPKGPLRELARKVTAYEAVTADDIQAVLDAGISEDATFECIVASAVGAGLHRLERGILAVGGVR